MVRAMRGSWTIVLVLAGCSGVAERPTARPPPPPSPDAAGPAAPTPDAPAPSLATTATPPPPPGWVDVAAVVPDAVLDLRYAGVHNLAGRALYPVARCWLRAEVAPRLVAAAAQLRRAGRRLLLWDCYRPASVQTTLWQLIGDPRYVARPRFDAAGRPISGSRHSRGAAIDVGLVGADGGLVPLPTDHDEVGPRAHRAAAAAATTPAGAAAELRLLDEALTAAGWRGLPTEWWHYDAPEADRLPLADVPLR